MVGLWGFRTRATPATRCPLDHSRRKRTGHAEDAPRVLVTSEEHHTRVTPMGVGWEAERYLGTSRLSTVPPTLIPRVESGPLPYTVVVLMLR